MASTSVSYVAIGGNRNYAVTFPSLAKSHIQVKVGGVIDITYTWLTDSTIRLSTIPAENALVEIRRITPQTPLVDFVDGSTLKEEQLDTATRQSIYIAQEAFEGVATSDTITDAITSTGFNATEAALSALEAEASATAAEAAKTASLVNADKAYKWAENAEGIPVQAGEYSAKHWAKKAQAVINMSAAYPIGSIYLNVTNVNPATLLGFGTWVAFATGRTLVGINPANALMDTPEETFGTADATLVSHSHTTDSSGNIVNASVSIAVESSAGGFTAASGQASLFTAVNGETLGSFNFPGTYYQGFSIVGGNHAHTTTTVGDSAVNKNYQPSIAIYMWKRTA